MEDEFDEIARAMLKASERLSPFDRAQSSQGRLTAGTMAMQAELADLRVRAGLPANGEPPSGTPWLTQVERDADLKPESKRIAAWLKQTGAGEVAPERIQRELHLSAGEFEAALDDLIDWGYVVVETSVRIRYIALRLLDDGAG